MQDIQTPGDRQWPALRLMQHQEQNPVEHIAMFKWVTNGSAVYLCWLASSAGAMAQAPSADDLTPYDAGYAFAASQNCPGVSLLVEIAGPTKSDEKFKSGQAMFDRYVAAMKIEGACQAALNLYNDKTGKTAKVLHVK
ncbi:MAG: hypothetical protein ACRETL_00210 [Gammaproteobacteria bacterium]